MPQRRPQDPEAALPPLPEAERKTTPVKIYLTARQAELVHAMRPDLKTPAAVVALLVNEVLAGRIRPEWVSPEWSAPGSVGLP